MRYRLIDYDVWGNDKDGYEVNQAFLTNTFIDLTDKIINDDKLLIKDLKKAGIIRKGIHANKIGILGDDITMYFEYKGRPEFELRRQ